jgi:transposase
MANTRKFGEMALAAVREDGAVAELSSRFGLHASQIKDGRKRCWNGSASLFSRGYAAGRNGATARRHLGAELQNAWKTPSRRDLRADGARVGGGPVLFCYSVDRRCASSLDSERLRKRGRFLRCSRFEEPMFSPLRNYGRAKLDGRTRYLPEAKNAS